jgi:hypothetical protein
MSIKNQHKKYYNIPEGYDPGEGELSNQDVFDFLDRVEVARSKETPTPIQDLLKSTQEKQSNPRMSKKEVNKNLKDNAEANPPKFPWESSGDKIDSYEEDSPDILKTEQSDRDFFHESPKDGTPEDKDNLNQARGNTQEAKMQKGNKSPDETKRIFTLDDLALLKKIQGTNISNNITSFPRKR